MRWCEKYSLTSGYDTYYTWNHTHHTKRAYKSTCTYNKDVTQKKTDLGFGVILAGSCLSIRRDINVEPFFGWASSREGLFYKQEDSDEQHCTRPRGSDGVPVNFRMIPGGMYEAAGLVLLSTRRERGLKL